MTVPPDFPQIAEPTQPAPPPPPPRYEEPIPTHLAWAVLVTILCCLPFGLVAVYHASRVSSFQAVGDRLSAMLAADRARLWCWIGAIVGLIWPFILIGMLITGGIGLLSSLHGLDVIFD